MPHLTGGRGRSPRTPLNPDAPRVTPSHAPLALLTRSAHPADRNRRDVPELEATQPRERRARTAAHGCTLGAARLPSERELFAPWGGPAALMRSPLPRGP